MFFVIPVAKDMCWRQLMNALREIDRATHSTSGERGRWVNDINDKVLILLSVFYDEGDHRDIYRWEINLEMFQVRVVQKSGRLDVNWRLLAAMFAHRPFWVEFSPVTWTWLEKIVLFFIKTHPNNNWQTRMLEINGRLLHNV